MKSRLFSLKNIASPGRVNIMHLGVVELENLPDDRLEKLWMNGCPYLQLTEEGMQKYTPDVKPIRIDELNVKNKKKKMFIK